MNWLNEAVISLFRKKSSKLSKLLFKKFFLVFILFSLIRNVFAQDCNFPIKEPPEAKNIEQNVPTQINIKNYPNFPKVDVSKIPSETAIDSRLRISLDTAINTKVSKVGDYFKAHVLEDFYLSLEPPVLIIPKGSWVRGRINFIKRPTLFIMSGTVNLKLYQIVTPYGEVSTLNTEVALQKGFFNSNGVVEPLEQNEKDINQEPLDQTVTVDKIDSKLIPFLISGTLKAMTVQNQENIYNPGQELQIILKKKLKFDRS